MRVGEYLPWLLATFAALIFVSAVSPERWSQERKRAFQLFVAVIFFLSIGAYWLTTGEKFDETAYRWILCRIHNFERCASVSEATTTAPPSQVPSQETEALKKVLEDLRREQREAEERRTKEQQNRETRQQAEDEARRQSKASAEAAAQAEAAKAALTEREAAGDAAIGSAFRYWRQANFEIAAQYFESALTVFKSLPNANDPRIRNKMAEAHSYVGFALALNGATAKNKRYGCDRLRLARKLYLEVGNSVQVARVDQDLNTAGCS